LIEKFAPIPDWHTPDPEKKAIVKKPSKGVLYYTDNRLAEPLFTGCQKQILKGIKEKHIVSVSLKPIKFGQNHVLELEPGYLTMARQILLGLEALKCDIVYFCEHDVLYHPSHFALLPDNTDKYFYNNNVWEVRVSDGHSLYHDNNRKLSQLIGYREFLIEHYRKRAELLELATNQMDESEYNRYVRQMGFEPGTHNREERVDDYKYSDLRSEVANLDLRHDTNLTSNRWSKDQFRNDKYTQGWVESESVPGWNIKKLQMGEK
jgi:hypothetical protein